MWFQKEWDPTREMPRSQLHKFYSRSYVHRFTMNGHRLSKRILFILFSNNLLIGTSKKLPRMVMSQHRWLCQILKRRVKLWFLMTLRCRTKKYVKSFSKITPLLQLVKKTNLLFLAKALRILNPKLWMEKLSWI